MTVSVTEADVQGIVEVDASISLTPFIDVAVSVVTKHCVDDDFTAAELNRIAIYLTAYFYCLRDRRAVSETAKGMGESLQHVEDLGFDANEYGQMAKRLDWSGALAALDSASKSGLRKTVELTWLGVPNDDATNEVTI